MRVIAFYNAKGGVGKTTLLTATASYLAREFGKRVLVMDTDPLATGTSYLLSSGIKAEKDGISTALGAHLRGGEVPEPVHIDPFGFDLYTGGENSRVVSQCPPVALRDFAHSFGDYDYVFVDVSSSVSARNKVVLNACDYVVFPMNADIMSFKGMDEVGRWMCTWYDETTSPQEALPHILGFIGNDFASVAGKPINEYERILELMPRAINVSFRGYVGLNPDMDYKLGMMRSFNSQAHRNMRKGKPIYPRTNIEQDMAHICLRLEENIYQIENPEKFLADKVAKLQQIAANSEPETARPAQQMPLRAKPQGGAPSSSDTDPVAQAEMGTEAFQEASQIAIPLPPRRKVALFENAAGSILPKNAQIETESRRSIRSRF